MVFVDTFSRYVEAGPTQIEEPSGLFTRLKALPSESPKPQEHPRDNAVHRSKLSKDFKAAGEMVQHLKACTVPAERT